jgi:hypothetical protein
MAELPGFDLIEILNIDLLDEVAWTWAALLAVILAASRLDAWLHDARA